jgi:periplasmic copper chaperone A
MLRHLWIATALFAASCSDPAPLVTVTEARVIATPASAAAYFTLTNSGGDDRLLAVEAPGTGEATLHETSMDGGVMRMRPIDGGVEVAKGEAVRFTPYGKHVMIMLNRPLDPTKPVRLRLTFEEQGIVTVDAPISSPGGMAN